MLHLLQLLIICLSYNILLTSCIEVWNVGENHEICPCPIAPTVRNERGYSIVEYKGQLFGVCLASLVDTVKRDYSIKVLDLSGVKEIPNRLEKVDFESLVEEGLFRDNGLRQIILPFEENINICEAAFYSSEKLEIIYPGVITLRNRNFVINLNNLATMRKDVISLIASEISNNNIGGLKIELAFLHGMPEVSIDSSSAKEFLQKSLSGKRELFFLDFSGLEMTDTFLSNFLAPLLMRKNSITKLDLSGNCLSMDSLGSLVKIISHNQKLQSLILDREIRIAIQRIAHILH